MYFASFALACVGVASAIPSVPYVLHERRVDTPKHWQKTARLAPDFVLPMRIGLTQSNLDIGDELLMEM
jgi:tripeptidyl-peptidase-1